MKHFFSLLFLLLISHSIFSQILDPVKWEVSVQKETDNEYVITSKATIDAKWHLYSQKQFGEEFEGPIRTEFAYNHTDSTYVLIGNTHEPNIKPIFDPVFDMDVVFFEHEAIFTQRIKAINPSGLKIKVEVLYSTCDDKQCLPPETKTFEIDLNSKKATAVNAEISQRDIDMTNALHIGIDVDTFKEDKKGLWVIFLLGFLGGLIALLTPCVFPMIPLTVSFFTKGAENKKKGLRNAILYGFFIFLIYVLLSIPFHLLDSLDPEILNNISTNVVLNAIFFAIFIIFAFSFFGYFELTLPSSWGAKMDDKANSIGGAIGIFFMAVTLAIVSFSCTGPILGTLLGSSLSSDGSGATELSVGMGGFGLALALPFALFALFPNMLNSLPKSGGWLNTVKVVLGFVEVALAFKFLSNADLVMHWGILKREIFIAIWILCSLGLVLYVFGFIRFPHDGPKKNKIPKGNFITGILSLAFMIYLIPGLTNTKYANLKLLSGLAPPLTYSIYDKGEGALSGLKTYKDFNEGVEAAKAEGKPIMIDFTGWACVNCRKMEEQVWVEPEIFKIIKDDYVLISLYVDDRKKLLEENQFNYLKDNGGVKSIKTIGDKWATFQTVNFHNNSQPYYVLMDSEFNLLNKPIGYTPNAQEYQIWLEEGLEKFSKE